MEKNANDLKQGDMIRVQYGLPNNFVNLRIRSVSRKDETTLDVNVFTPSGHPDTIQLDVAEIVEVIEGNEEKKGNDVKMAESRVMGVHKKLAEVQRKLIAPKNQYNSFGKYKYRSCEDILEGVKPLLSEVGATLTITDEIVPCGDRIYVKATATFTDIESQEKIINSAFAREEESKKGMDSSQVTGATSSYARKYALNGLFCIDDNKDPDTEEFKNQQNSGQGQQNKQPQQGYQQPQAQHQQQSQQPQQQQGHQYKQQQDPNQASVYMVQTVRKLCSALRVDEGQVIGFVASKKLETMTVQEFNIIMENFKATPGYSESLIQQ